MASQKPIINPAAAAAVVRRRAAQRLANNRNAPRADSASESALPKARTVSDLLEDAAHLEALAPAVGGETIARENMGREPLVRPARPRRSVREETREQMLDRLLNPQISLYEASVILGVCPTTVRRYSDSGQLPHVRTEGQQRRFQLKHVLALLRTREREARMRQMKRQK